MSGRRERPSDAEVKAWVSHARGPVLAHAVPRRWWRLKRSLIAGAVVAAVAAGGIAYAAVERTRTPEPPTTVKGNAVIQIGAPGPGDKWLNLSISYRCKPGEGFELRDDRHLLAGANCDRQMFVDEKRPGELQPGPGGLQKSVPLSKVFGTELSLTSTLTDAAIIEAEFGPTSASSGPEILPPAGPGGEPGWVIPTYPVNEYGLTVGQIRINVPESAYPDLIPVTFEGREAYLLKEQFIVRSPGDPSEPFDPEAERARRGQRIDEDGRLFQRVFGPDGQALLGWRYSGKVRCSAC